jgi:hypothetical protein
MQRHIFRLASTGGTRVGDTGRLAGAIQQMRWHPNTTDTGQPSAFTLSILPDGTDSGPGWVFYSQAAVNLGAAFTKAPRQPMHGSDGNVDPADTGSQSGVEVVGANDRLRVKISPADTGVVVDGRLYVWSRE